MRELTKLIYDDMKPALGVTEPGAIAYAVSTACSRLPGRDYDRILVRMNSGMFKNAFTCGIAGTDQVGNDYAAALGAVAADPEKKLECLDGITDADVVTAGQLIQAGKVKIEMTEITSRIYIEAVVAAGTEEASVVIEDAHTNITRITVNGEEVFTGRKEDAKEEEKGPAIHRYTLAQLVDYVQTVDSEEIAFIDRAFVMNRQLLEEGLASDRTTFGPYLLAANGGQLVSDHEQKTASLFCNGAIEARVIGLARPAMSITGSGAHGIIATMPLLAAAKVRGYSSESLRRATALSYLVCMYIKEYSGKLSAFCGCAIAAGTGMACGLVLLRGGSVEDMERTINNMSGSITGMICDGGNQGCTMKGVVAVDAAYRSVELAMAGVAIDAVHGINGPTPEETMRNMGLIASPGMVGTEKTIIDILEIKNDQR